ncbi:uncharacterized protein LOC107981424 [Nasonia vitripennis]|uniref:Uncharacterized protein n=1 Tax=Nasonia vitripennis TaxID=7425 RepID=A0A7M7IVQ1_NASVI|nr:uncharacterized protein LOC107981424 [Nasonia vitripennis]
MSGNKRYVNVTCEGRTLKLQTNNEGDLPLPLLRIYFPNAQGLTYKKDKQEYASTIVSDVFILDKEVDNYNVIAFCNSGTSHLVKLEEQGLKKQRVMQIMEALKGSKEKGKENKSCASNKASCPPPKKAKLVPSKDRKLKVGWIHKESEGDIFIQIKAPMGGMRTLILNDRSTYTATDILDLATTEFMKNTSFTQDLFKDCRLELGLFNGTPLPHFLDVDGNACDFWKYCASQGKSLYRLKLYLLSILNKATGTDVQKHKETYDVQENEQRADVQKNEKTDDGHNKNKENDDVQESEKLENLKDFEATNLKMTEDEKVPWLDDPDEEMSSFYKSEEMFNEMLEMNEDSETDDE